MTRKLIWTKYGQFGILKELEEAKLMLISVYMTIH